ncbi:MAG: DUF6320 domain-containing protein [Gulosibacter sp.]|uniref:DUF6320 domain-containing protein n=1 Tax=Gulosibacter sp. TaxID=2817531 RepID=UPI003F93002B
MSPDTPGRDTTSRGNPRRCADCDIAIEGAWMRCPLCGAAVTGEATPSPLPAIPLTFSRRRVLKTLFLTSLGVILASFSVQLFFGHDIGDLGIARSIWLGVTAMWLVVLMAVRKRHNVAKSTVYLVLLIGLICVYWDYLSGWNGWALTYAVPIVCAAAAVGLLITVRLMRIEVGDHIVYSGLTGLLGLAPIAFLVFGWVNNPWPSFICIAVSVIVIVLVQVIRGRSIGHELGKRFHL